MYFFSFSDVWSKFLEFEATCGDLASLVKVENRKMEAYKEVSKELILYPVSGFCLLWLFSFVFSDLNTGLSLIF